MSTKSQLESETLNNINGSWQWIDGALKQISLDTVIEFRELMEWTKYGREGLIKW